jgi:hypothetical protein
MYTFGNFGFIDTLLLWYGIVIMTGGVYGFFAFNGSHHHNEARNSIHNDSTIFSHFSNFRPFTMATS